MTVSTAHSGSWVVARGARPEGIVLRTDPESRVGQEFECC